MLAALVLLFSFTPPRLPFMYPDGVHFDLLCVCYPPSPFPRPIHSLPAGVFLLSFYSHTHAHTVLTHIIVSWHTIKLISGLSLLCADDLFALPLLSRLNVKSTLHIFLWWIFNEVFNSWSGLLWPFTHKANISFDSILFKLYLTREIS